MKNILNDSEAKRDVLRYVGLFTLAFTVVIWLFVSFMFITGDIDVNKKGQGVNKSCVVTQTNEIPLQIKMGKLNELIYASN